MSEITHEELVTALAKPGEDVLATLTPPLYSLMVEVMTAGVNAGERLDAMKKQVIYGKSAGDSPRHILPMRSDITAEQCHLIHMALGIFGEAGELLENLSSAFQTGNEPDWDNVVEELGDLEFYMEGLRQGSDISRTDCLEGNIEKLSVRYESLSYSDDAAIERADKNEDPGLQLQDDRTIVNSDVYAPAGESTEDFEESGSLSEEYAEEDDDSISDAEGESLDAMEEEFENENPHSEANTGEANPNTMN